MRHAFSDQVGDTPTIASFICPSAQRLHVLFALIFLCFLSSCRSLPRLRRSDCRTIVKTVAWSVSESTGEGG